MNQSVLSIYDLLKIFHNEDRISQNLYDFTNAVTVISFLCQFCSITCIFAYFIMGFNPLWMLAFTALVAIAARYLNKRFETQLACRNKAFEACLKDFPDVYVHASRQAPKVLKSTYFMCIINGVRKRLNFVHREVEGGHLVNYWEDPATGDSVPADYIFYEQKLGHWFSLMDDETYVDLHYLTEEEHV